MLSACHDENITELKDLQRLDTFFYNLYGNVYSEDTNPQTIIINTCNEQNCSEGFKEVELKVPRDYFYKTSRAEDTRSYIEKHFLKSPRPQWPEFSSTEYLAFLMSCEGDGCASYPSTCEQSKIKCAKPLRSSNFGILPRDLVEVEFQFYPKIKKRYGYDAWLPDFSWTPHELIETLEGGYKRFTTKRMSKAQKAQGGLYMPATDADIFDRIQCSTQPGGCEYLFYLDIDESFSKSLYGDEYRPLLVKASFTHIERLKYDFDEINKRLEIIRTGVCNIVPCKNSVGLAHTLNTF